MHYLFILLVISSHLMSATNDVKEAQAGIKALMAPLIPGAAHNQSKAKVLDKFRIDGCEKHKVDWQDVLLKQTEVVLEYKFKEGCDIQGTLRPKLFQSFPASLELRNLKDFSKVESINRITMGLQQKPVVFLEMRSGILKGAKGNVNYEADYQVQLNPLDSKNMVEDNKGGEIRISEIYGEKVKIKEKIKVK